MVPYFVMNGIGNQITVVDLRDGKVRLTADHARAIAAEPRTRFDQVMVLYPPKTPGTDAYMTIFNTDGSPAEACGNGTRCVAHLLFDEKPSDRLILETQPGLLHVSREDDGQLTVDMGMPRFEWEDIPLSEPFHDTKAIELQVGPINDPILDTPSVANIGNPHAIFWVDDVTRYDMAAIGPMLEYHPMFPERANITIAQVTAPDAMVIVTWERGAGLTRACGSAACAATVSAARKRLTGRDVTVSLPGGDLRIRWRESDDHILMTGGFELERSGEMSLEPFMISEAA